MDIPDILAMKDRRYLMIAIDKIKVLNSRNRDEDQFQLNIQSIENSVWRGRNRSRRNSTPSSTLTKGLMK